VDTLFYIQQCSSTNDEIINLLKSHDGIRELTLYTFDQTKGRGQYGNTWDTAPNQNLAFSMALLQNEVSQSDTLFNFHTANILRDFIVKKTETKVEVKWPNDIIIHHKKVSGMLIEKKKIGKNVICIDEEIPFEIPKNWRWCRVRDLGLTETGTTPPKSNPNFFGDHIPFLSPANIQQNRIANENQWLSKEGMLYGRVVPCNSILQVCIGGSIGKCAIVNKSVTFNQQINSITPILCEPKFLYYYLLSNTFFLAMIEKSTGTATPIINKGNWERLLFPLPPLAEQLRIVESIDAIFRCIEN